MRDKRKPKGFFDELLALQDQYFHSEDNVSIYQKANEGKASNMRDFYALTYCYCREFAADIPYMYCRGDALADISTQRADILAERYAWVANEIESQGYTQKNYFNHNLIEPHGLHEAYSILCWLLCFNVSDNDITALAVEFGPAGKDRLVDTILARYQPDRVIASGSGHPATFQLLDDVIDASESDRIVVLQRYMKEWGKLLSNLNGLGSIGIFRQKKLTNKTLGKDVGAAYKGYWMWEVALLIKFFGIDDSSFIDNEFYPADLVHFKRPQDNSGSKEK